MRRKRLRKMWRRRRRIRTEKLLFIEDCGKLRRRRWRTEEEED